MTYTVAIILPRWMAYLLVVICILQVVETALKIYRDHLKSKLPKPGITEEIDLESRCITTYPCPRCGSSEIE